jgi:hypothetical protein
VPFQEPTVTTPFAKLTPEMTEVLVDSTLIVPPIKALPVTPRPPDTVIAPVNLLDEFVKLVTAKPDTVTKPLDGFITNVETVDNPIAELEAELTTGMKNDALTTVGVTATEEAAAGGTACQVGKLPAPFDVKTCPLVLLAANLPQAVVVVA